MIGFYLCVVRVETPSSIKYHIQWRGTRLVRSRSLLGYCKRTSLFICAETERIFGVNQLNDVATQLAEPLPHLRHHLVSEHGGASRVQTKGVRTSTA